MSASHQVANPELEIWERVFVPDPRRIGPDQARYLLDVRFPQADLDRIDSLSAKASEGTLTAGETAELEHYVHVGHLLSILKAKVRGTVNKATDRL